MEDTRYSSGAEAGSSSLEAFELSVLNRFYIHGGALLFNAYIRCYNIPLNAALALSPKFDMLYFHCHSLQCKFPLRFSL